jgi:hypothetical protein
MIVHSCNHSQGISLKEPDLVALMVNNDDVLAYSFHCHTLVSLPADLCGSLLLSLIKFHYLSLQILKVSLSVLPHRCCITWNQFPDLCLDLHFLFFAFLLLFDVKILLHSLRSLSAQV